MLGFPSCGRFDPGQEVNLLLLPPLEDDWEKSESSWVGLKESLINELKKKKKKR